MTKSTRGRYTLEFKQEAARLVSRVRARQRQHAILEWSSRPWATGLGRIELGP